MQQGHNQLQTLPASAFTGLNNLALLDLPNNQLQTLSASAFTGLNNLQAIDLTNNQLQMLPAAIFNGLNNLSTLDLTNNQLQTLPATIFNGLPKLRELYLIGNRFSVDFLLTLPSIIKSIPSLRKLDGKPVDEALESYRIYQPKTLKETTKEYLRENLTPEDLEEVALVHPEAFELLPLTSQQKAAIIAKNLEAFRDRLYKLPKGILDLLPLTPQQRAAIAAQQRQLSQPAT